jgi:hypothetical protein
VHGISIVSNSESIVHADYVTPDRILSAADKTCCFVMKHDCDVMSGPLTQFAVQADVHIWSSAQPCGTVLETSRGPFGGGGGCPHFHSDISNKYLKLKYNYL